MKFVARILLAVLPLLFLNGCLTKRTVTRDGYVVEDTYVFRRPLKEAFENEKSR